MPEFRRHMTCTHRRVANSLLSAPRHSFVRHLVQVLRRHRSGSPVFPSEIEAEHVHTSGRADAISHASSSSQQVVCMASTSLQEDNRGTRVLASSCFARDLRRRASVGDVAGLVGELAAPPTWITDPFAQLRTSRSAPCLDPS